MKSTSPISRPQPIISSSPYDFCDLPQTKSYPTTSHHSSPDIPSKTLFGKICKTDSFSLCPISWFRPVLVKLHSCVGYKLIGALYQRSLQSLVKPRSKAGLFWRVVARYASLSIDSVAITLPSLEIYLFILYCIRQGGFEFCRNRLNTFITDFFS